MKKIYSAGGVVIKNNSVLMLKKTSGHWVLPKGRIEFNETEKEAAIREVEEETGIRAEIITDLGDINYKYSKWHNNEVVDKHVKWFLMKEVKGFLNPLKEEGFVEAKYISIENSENFAQHEEERTVISKAIKKNIIR